MVQICTLLTIAASVAEASARSHPLPNALDRRDTQGGVMEVYRRSLVSESGLEARDTMVEVPGQDLQVILDKLAQLQQDVEGLLANTGDQEGSDVQIDGDNSNSQSDSESNGEQQKDKSSPAQSEGSPPDTDLDPTTAGSGPENEAGIMAASSDTMQEEGPSPEALDNVKALGELDGTAGGNAEETGEEEQASPEGPASGSPNDGSAEDGEDEPKSTITLTSTSTKSVTVTRSDIYTHTHTATALSVDAEATDVAEIEDVEISSGPSAQPPQAPSPRPSDTDPGSDAAENSDDAAAMAAPRLQAVKTSGQTGSQPRSTAMVSSTPIAQVPPAAVTDTAPSALPSAQDTPSMATAPEEVATPAPRSSADMAAPLGDVNLQAVVSTPSSDSPRGPAQVNSTPTTGTSSQDGQEDASDVETGVEAVASESEDAQSSEPDAMSEAVAMDMAMEEEALVTPGRQTNTGFKTLVRL